MPPWPYNFLSALTNVAYNGYEELINLNIKIGLQTSEISMLS